jgi:broad specificity phosphatase PhoE
VSRTTVHLLRHGEVFNPDKVLYGRLAGFRLSEAGEAMAERVAGYLAGRDVTYLTSSPLERAQQTAKPIAAEFGLDVMLDENLIEAANAFEGRRVAGPGGVLKYPSSWSKFRNPARPSWGEPYQQILARMLAAAQLARTRAEGHEAVCVSHQLPIVCLRRYAEGKRLWHDPRRRQCSLASLTSLTFEGERIVGVAYAEPAGSTPNRLEEQPPGA